MSRLERLLTSLYGCLLRLFPRPFRREFEPEMLGVFSAALRKVGTAPGSPGRRRIAMVRLYLHEVIDLPAAVWSALRFRPAQVVFSAMPVDQEGAGPKTPEKEGHQAWDGEPSPWGEALLGAIPFILYGLAYFLIALDEWSANPSRALQVYAPQVVYYLSDRKSVV